VGLPRSKLVKSKLCQGVESGGTSPPVATPFETANTEAAFCSPIALLGVEDTTEREVAITDHAIEEAPARGRYHSAISTHELLDRAAALGPVRTTWESIVLHADPILDEKRQPHVAQRRARLTRLVTFGLGACLAVCVVAIGASALSSGDGSSASSASASVTSAIGKTVPSKAIVPVEALDGTKHAKLGRRLTPTVATVVHAKRR
jgi:hypothetical protein